MHRMQRWRDHKMVQSARNPGPEKQSDELKPQCAPMGWGSWLSHGASLVSVTSPVLEWIDKVRSFQTFCLSKRIFLLNVKFTQKLIYISDMKTVIMK